MLALGLKHNKKELRELKEKDVPIKKLEGIV